MFWKPSEPHGLPHNPQKSCVIPRPIGWISTIGADGSHNLAPYSYFNTVCDSPWIVMFSGGSRSPGDPKDSVANAEATGEFVCSMVTFDLAEKMNQTSAAVDKGVDEAEWAGLEMEPSVLVKPRRVKDSPIHLECKFLEKKPLPSGSTLCFGEVIGVNIRDDVLKDGIVDVEKIRPVARLGYLDYAVVDTIFSLPRPKV